MQYAFTPSYNPDMFYKVKSQYFNEPIEVVSKRSIMMKKNVNDQFNNSKHRIFIHSLKINIS